MLQLTRRIITLYQKDKDTKHSKGPSDSDGRRTGSTIKDTGRKRREQQLFVLSASRGDQT